MRLGNGGNESLDQACSRVTELTVPPQLLVGRVTSLGQFLLINPLSVFEFASNSAQFRPFLCGDPLLANVQELQSRCASRLEQDSEPMQSSYASIYDHPMKLSAPLQISALSFKL